jgi:hypothetical protein
MPKVETYALARVQNSPMPGARFTVQASPEAFGAGFGKGLSELGQKITEEQAKRQDDLDTGRAKEAIKKLYTNGNTLMNDPKEGYLNSSGKDAFDRSADTKKQLQALKEAALAELDNENQRKAAIDRMDSYLADFDVDIDRHASRGLRAWEDATHESTLTVASARAANSYMDEERMRIALKEGEAEIISYGMDRNMTPEELAAKKQGFYDGAYQTIINRMMASNDFERANDFYNGNAEKPGVKAYIQDPEVKNKIEGQLEDGVRNNKSRRMVDEIYKSGVPINELTKSVREAAGDDTQLADEAIRRLKIRRDEDDAAKGEINKAAYNEAGKMVLDGGSVDSIPRNRWHDMTFDQQKNLKELEASMKSGARKTDLATWNQLNRMAATKPEEFKRIELMDYVGKLDQSDFQEFGKLQRSIASGDKTQLTHIQSIDSKASKALKNIGVDVDDDKGQLFMRKLQDDISALENAEGRKIKPQEVDAIIDKMMISGEVKGNILRDPDKRLFEVESGETFFMDEAPRVPEIERKKIEDTLRRRGIEPTEEAISNLYLKKVTRQ